MKKLLSLIMAGAMVASLVPATAFAASSSEVTATAKVVKALEKTEDFNDLGGVGVITGATTPELQVKISGVDYLVGGGTNVDYELTVSLDNADLNSAVAATLAGLVKVVDEDGNVLTTLAGASAAKRDQLVVAASEIGDDEVTFTITGIDTWNTAGNAAGADTIVDGRLAKNDIITVALDSTMDKTSAGKTATVSLESDGVDVDDLVYCTILDTGITASVKKTVDVAEDEVKTLDSKGLKIKAAVGNILPNQVFELKLSSGFEFSRVVSTATYTFGAIDDNVVRVAYNGAAAEDFTIAGAGIEIEATTAKSGAVATLTVKADKKNLADTGVSLARPPISASSSVEVAKVCDYKVNLTVDEDEDVPVIY
ncbi:MAG: hypothetical protein EOM28_10070, partial [Clostridia bacterium]|nr:hypothetical protein [Clostridia bacterium]